MTGEIDAGTLPNGADSVGLPLPPVREPALHGIVSAAPVILLADAPSTLAERNAARNAERDRQHRENAERAERQRREWAEREEDQRREREALAEQGRQEQEARRVAALRAKAERDCGLDGGMWSAADETCALSPDGIARRQQRQEAEAAQQLTMMQNLVELFILGADPGGTPAEQAERDRIHGETVEMMHRHQQRFGLGEGH